MLTISQIKDPSYYGQWTTKNYYNNTGELRGTWSGKLAPVLGLSGEVQTQDYQNIIEGFSPDGKEALVRNAGKDHAPGHDLTFSAPKDVSILQVFDKNGQILRAHELAVKAALRYIEQNAAFTRRNAQGKDIEQLPGLLFAMFTHFESRTEDMQLHSHCLAFNIGRRLDKSFGSVLSRSLYQWKMASGAVYRAELAQQLRLLGYTIGINDDSFHVVGVPKDICEYYSKRAEQIEKNLKALGAKSSASSVGQYAKLKDRQKKAKTPLPELTDRWQCELKTLGFSYKQAREIQRENATYSFESINASQALCDLTETRSMFKLQDLHHHLAIQAQRTGDNAITISFEAKQCLDSETVVSLGQDHKKNRIFTTTVMLEIEQHMITLAQKLSQQSHNAPDSEAVKQAVEQKQTQCGYQLSEEQVEGIQTACSPTRLSILQGSAGSGKSVSLAALRIAFEAMGDRVIGACIAKVAVDNLQRETGIQSMTIAKLLTDIERGRNVLSNVSVLVIDEAGQVGSKQMQALLNVAEASQTKVVLVGEDKQLDAIEHGGVLKYLSRPEIIGTSVIKTVRRQREIWARQTVMQLRDGHAKDALATLNEHQLVNFTSSHEAAIKKLVAKWKHYTTERPNKGAVVLAQRWTEVEAISNQLRGVYQDRGLVGHENILFDCVVSNKLMTLPFSVGERVRFAQNDYRLNVSNGSLGTLTKLEMVQNQWQFHIKLDDHRTVIINQNGYQNEQGRLPLVHAYAMTIYSSQGVTVDGDTFILYNAHMDRANCYVAGSRHKDNSHWFINNKEIDALTSPDGGKISAEQRIAILAEQMSREQLSTLAIEHLTDKQRLQYLIAQPTAELTHVNDNKMCQFREVDLSIM
jgi:conjugative relaxase-like TrwC/TraI family protein